LVRLSYCRFSEPNLTSASAPLDVFEVGFQLCLSPTPASSNVKCPTQPGRRSLSEVRRDLIFFSRAGFRLILSPGRPGTPPCKSGQLEKDLELEASSVRQAARLIIFEIMI